MQCNAIQRGGTGGGGTITCPGINMSSVQRRKLTDLRNAKRSSPQHRVTPMTTTTTTVAVVTRNKKSNRPFTDTLSPEARLAMRSTKADEIAGKQTASKSSLEHRGKPSNNNNNSERNVDASGTRSCNYDDAEPTMQDKLVADADGHKSDNSCKMADIYDKFSPCNHIGADHRDSLLTMEDTDILNQHVIRTARGHIRAIGGGKVTSAMETVEVVIADEPPDYVTQPTDEEVSAEMTRASVEKCLVWMEANQRMQGQSSGCQ